MNRPATASAAVVAPRQLEQAGGNPQASSEMPAAPSHKRTEGLCAQNRAMAARIKELEEENRLLTERVVYVQNVSKTYREKVAMMLVDIKKKRDNSRQRSGSIEQRKENGNASKGEEDGNENRNRNNSFDRASSCGSLEALAHRLRTLNIAPRAPSADRPEEEDDDGLMNSVHSAGSHHTEAGKEDVQKQSEKSSRQRAERTGTDAHSKKTASSRGRKTTTAKETTSGKRTATKSAGGGPPPNAIPTPRAVAAAAATIENLLAEKRNLTSLVDSMKIQMTSLKKRNNELSRQLRAQASSGGADAGRGGHYSGAAKTAGDSDEPHDHNHGTSSQPSPSTGATVAATPRNGNGSASRPAAAPAAPAASRSQPPTARDQPPAPSEPPVQPQTARETTRPTRTPSSAPDPRLVRFVETLSQRNMELEQQVHTLSTSADHFTKEIAHYKTLLEQKRAELVAVHSKESLVSRAAYTAQEELNVTNDKVKALEQQVRLLRLHEGRRRSEESSPNRSPSHAVPPPHDESLAIRALKTRLDLQQVILQEAQAQSEQARLQLEHVVTHNPAPYTLVAFAEAASAAAKLRGRLYLERAALFRLGLNSLAAHAEGLSEDVIATSMSALMVDEDCVAAVSDIHAKVVEKCSIVHRPEMEDAAVETQTPVLISLGVGTTPSMDPLKLERVDCGVETDSPVLISLGVVTTPTLSMNHDIHLPEATFQLPAAYHSVRNAAPETNESYQNVAHRPHDEERHQPINVRSTLAAREGSIDSTLTESSDTSLRGVHA